MDNINNVNNYKFYPVEKNFFSCIKFKIIGNILDINKSILRGVNMLFDNLYKEENKEAYKSYTEAYYSSRSHQDGEKQFCSTCGDVRDFLYDRCSVCKNN